MEKIGLVVATLGELETLLKENSSSYEELSNDNFKVYLYEIKSKKVYVILAGIGEIAASNATQYLLDTYKVDIILNYGLVGALVEKVSCDELCIVEGIVDYQFDISKIDDCPPLTHVEFGFSSPIMEIDPYLLDKVERIAKGKHLKVKLASGNLFLDGEKEKIEIAARTGCQICDMEAAGIYLTAKRNAKSAIFLKSVSDSATSGAKEYNADHEKSKKRARELAFKIIENL